jgi:hypothetical protein
MVFNIKTQTPPNTSKLPIPQIIGKLLLHGEKNVTKREGSYILVHVMVSTKCLLYKYLIDDYVSNLCRHISGWTTYVIHPGIFFMLDPAAKGNIVGMIRQMTTAF